MSEVYITRTSNYLPNSVISNDEMEDFLGCIGERASKSRRIVLRSNGIENRYYALDKNGQATHNNAEITSLAVRELFAKNPEELSEIDLLACGTSVPDQMMPSHGVMVHGYLPETGHIEVITPAGNCCSGMHAFKYAFLSAKAGMTKKAVCTGSERLSRMLHADQFEIELQKMEELESNPHLAFEKDFLRWMLSDGAGAFLVETEKPAEGLALRVEWIDTCSLANELETCMYMANVKLEDGSMKSFMDYSPQEILDQSILSIKQDVRLLGENIVKIGHQKLIDSLKKRGIAAEEITFFLPHLSSFFFKDKIAKALEEGGMGIPYDRWFTNLREKGNVGAGSIYLMLDELMHSGKLKVGDKILLSVPESARFAYAFSLLTVC